MPAPAVVLFVADVARLTTFYQDVEQMRLLHQEREYAVRAIKGLELSIHGLSQEWATATDPSRPVTAASRMMKNRVFRAA